MEIKEEKNEKKKRKRKKEGAVCQKRIDLNQKENLVIVFNPSDISKTFQNYTLGLIPNFYSN